MSDSALAALKNDLIRHYRWLRQHGCNDSHSGNISFRHGSDFWITPTGACADLVEASDLVCCPVEGEPTAGASGDANLHQAVYRANGETGAIVHSHGPYTVGLTLNGQNFIPDDFEGQLYFPEVPVISVPYVTYFREAAPKVAALLATTRICVVRGHGVYAQAATLNLAYKWSCSLELSAKTAFIARSSGTVFGR